MRRTVTTGTKRAIAFVGVGITLSLIAACAWMYSAPAPLHVES